MPSITGWALSVSIGGIVEMDTVIPIKFTGEHGYRDNLGKHINLL
jgi:hypothetical protein